MASEEDGEHLDRMNCILFSNVTIIFKRVQ